MTTTASTLRELEGHLDRWTLRLRLRDALRWGVRGLLGGLAAGLGLSLVARLRPLQTVPVLLTVALGLTLGGFILALVLAYVWRRPRLSVARYFDRALGLRERTSTALELASGLGLAPDWLVRDQWADAARAARGADPKRVLPFHISTLDTLLTLALAAGLALSLYLPNPQQAILARQQEVEQAIAQQVEQIEALRSEILNDPNLTDEQKEALTEPLDEALTQLQNGDLTQEQAVQALTQAQADLRALADPQAQAQADALQQAGDTLGDNPTTQPAGDALASGDFQAAAEALGNIDLSQLTEAERQALADKLEAAAQQLAESAPDVAQQFQAAADALRQGNVDAAQAALRSAGQAVGHYGAAFAQAQAAGQAADALAQSQAAVAQAGQGGSQPGGAQGQQPGQGTSQGGQGTGQGQAGQGGQGSGQSDGQGGTGGSGRGEGSGEAQGGAAGSDPIGQGNGPGDGGERPYEPIYTPYNLGGTGGEDVVLPGSGGTGGDVLGEGPVNPQNAGEVTVPYNEVYSAYSDTAHSAIDNGEVPPDLVDVVRQYFSSLEP